MSQPNFLLKFLIVALIRHRSCNVDELTAAYVFRKRVHNQYFYRLLFTIGPFNYSDSSLGLGRRRASNPDDRTRTRANREDNVSGSAM